MCCDPGATVQGLEVLRAQVRWGRGTGREMKIEYFLTPLKTLPGQQDLEVPL